MNEYGEYFSYNDMLPLLQEGWTEEYDNKANVSYYFSPDKSAFVTMENPATILTKIQWIMEEKYKGVFWWEFNYDAIQPASQTGKIRHHLIDVVSHYLDGMTEK
ncbi:glycosyl hydrolase family 18 protein [Bacteroides sp. CR5/BHMF/2]|nr:glycosyl hydrolase family 18 protein [Bacteroides sp. CR5/BHMF/2]